MGLPGSDRSGRGPWRPSGRLRERRRRVRHDRAGAGDRGTIPLRVIALVHNDSTYGAIKNIQDRAHEGRHLDTNLNNPDFSRLAEAYGVPARQARNPDELLDSVREALERDGPSLIEVPDQWRFLRDLATPFRRS